MGKKDILGYQWLSKSFLFSAVMQKLNGPYEGYVARQIFLPGTRELWVEQDSVPVRLSGEGYVWITYQPTKDYWALTAFYDDKGSLIRWYFDLSGKNYLDENGIPCREDMFLDLIILPDGRTEIKDEDELQQALNNGEITAEEYHHVHRVCKSLLDSRWSDVAFLTEVSHALLSIFDPT